MSPEMNGAGRPFTVKVQTLRSNGERYADLEYHSNRARSTAWFNNLVNGPRWAVSPPDDKAIPGFARLFRTDEAHVRRMIAEEWYGVIPSESSQRVASIATRLDALTDEDMQLVEALITRLSKDVASRA